MAAKGKLTQRQQSFVVAYIACLEPRQAALKAGYPPRAAAGQGERLLAQRPIVEAIARAVRDRPTQADATAEPPAPRAPFTKTWITDELTELYGMVKACLTAPAESGAKAPSGASLQSVIRTLELLIKHLEAEGLCQTEEGGEAEPDLSRLTRDELRQLEALLARAQPDSGPEGAGPAEPF
jgi:hypothetical protein